MKNKKCLALFASIMSLSAFSSVQAASVEGVIKGAQCYFQKGECAKSKSDPHLVLENDFVLVSGDNYYFLPNLPRSEKLNVYNETVRVEGAISNKIINVDKVVLTQGKSHRVLWDEQEIFDELYEG